MKIELFELMDRIRRRLNGRGKSAIKPDEIDQIEYDVYFEIRLRWNKPIK